MENWLDEEEIKDCQTCKGPIVMRVGFDGESYIVAVENRTVRIDYENAIIRDRLARAERIIVTLRKKVGELESR